MVENNTAFQFPGLGNTLPRNVARIPDSTIRQLEPLAASRELRLQIERVNYHRDTILAALNSIIAINRAMLANDWKNAEQLIVIHKELYGFSILIAKKELFTSFQRGGLIGLSKKYQALTDGAERRSWALISHLIYDSADPAFHPARSIRVWLNSLEDLSEEFDWYSAIIFWELRGYVDNQIELSQTCLRYNAVSILDLTIFLHQALHVHGDWDVLRMISQHLDPSLQQKLKEGLEKQEISVPPSYLDTDTLTDVSIYRTMFFYSEIGTVARWRSELNELLFGRRRGQRSDFEPSSLLRATISELGNDVSLKSPSMTQLERWAISLLAPRVKIDTANFLRAVAVAEYLKSVASSSSLDSNKVIALISATQDLQEYVPIITYAKMVANPAVIGSPLLNFVVRDQVFRRARTLDNDLERRAIFMDLFPSYDRANIIPYLDNVLAWSPATAIYLARSCTRTFLERLYLIMSSVKDVIETRIEICAWLISVDDSDSAKAVGEELDALEHELANLDARSDLDSTRVHVDEESLREWYDETQRATGARYTQTVLAEGANAQHGTLLAYYNRSKEQKKLEDEDGQYVEESQIGSEFVLLRIVEETLEAFVSDKTFGLDAYLSRRIRHGTLIGFMLTPVSRIVRKVEEALVEGDSETEQDALSHIHNTLEAWRGELAAELDHARKGLIQVRSESHPDGLIEATWRFTSNVTHLDATLSRVRGRVLSTRGTYDFFPDVYALCWDLIERDLAQIRRYLLRTLYRQMAEHLAHRYSELSHEQKVVGQPYFAELQSALINRVQEVCGWFIRPVFRRDNYDLRTLIDSTISIIRELDDDFLFFEEVKLDESVAINRGSFEVIGDILFVLIGNAAKHGKRGGRVYIECITVEESEPVIILEVTSEVGSKDDFNRHLARIQDAFEVSSVADLASAAVEEGFSGIRKIVGVIRRVRSPLATVNIFKDDDDNSITFRISLPQEISFRRERT